MLSQLFKIIVQDKSISTFYSNLTTCAKSLNISRDRLRERVNNNLIDWKHKRTKEIFKDKKVNSCFLRLYQLERYNPVKINNGFYLKNINMTTNFVNCSEQI